MLLIIYILFLRKVCSCLSLIFSTGLIVLYILGNSLYIFAAAAAAKSLQLCPTLCNPIDGSSTGSPEDPVYSLHFSGHRSCPHTGVCHNVLVREELKISPGSREHSDPDQESRALPSELVGKGEGL